MRENFSTPKNARHVKILTRHYDETDRLKDKLVFGLNNRLMCNVIVLCYNAINATSKNVYHSISPFNYSIILTIDSVHH